MKLKKLYIIFLCNIVLFLFTGCAGKSSANEVNIGYFNNITHAQALYLKATGSLEKAFPEGTSINWVAFNAGPAEVEALFAGSIDIGYIGPVPAVTANVKSNGDISIISSATKGGAILVTRKDSMIDSIADLDGKTVAIPQIGNTQHLCLLKLLNDNNLADINAGGTVTVTAVANADVANMMDRGDIDAALVPEPWGATLISNGAKLLLDYHEVYSNGDYDVAVVVVRKDFLNEHPEIVKAFLKEHETATDVLNSDSTLLLTINSEIYNATGKSLDENILNESFSRIGISTEINQKSIMGLAEESLSQEIINAVPNDSSLFTEIN